VRILTCKINIRSSYNLLLQVQVCRDIRRVANANASFIAIEGSWWPDTRTRHLR